MLQDISSAIGIIDSSFTSAPAIPPSSQTDSATLLGSFGVLFRTLESAEWINELIESASYEYPGGTTCSADKHLEKASPQLKSHGTIPTLTCSFSPVKQNYCEFQFFFFWLFPENRRLQLGM